MYSPRKATDTEISQFHSDDYVAFLRRVSPDNVVNFTSFLSRYAHFIDGLDSMLELRIVLSLMACLIFASCILELVSRELGRLGAVKVTLL
jgi:acetoin utilization deacetylase AcuC-like enzyme